MNSYAVEGKDLHHMSFKDAQQISQDCEENFFEIGRKIGGWEPTREMLHNHMRYDMDDRYRVRGHIRSMWWCIGIEALAILALIALHLVR